MTEIAIPENFLINLKSVSQKEYLKHLNQYDVLKINMQEFLSGTHSMDEMLDYSCKKR